MNKICVNPDNLRHLRAIARELIDLGLQREFQSFKDEVQNKLVSIRDAFNRE